MREIRMVGCPRNNLVELLETLLAHAQQLELWGQMGSLNSYWLPGFLDPGLFVTVIQQEAAKAAGRSLSEVQVEAGCLRLRQPRGCCATSAWRIHSRAHG